MLEVVGMPTKPAASLAKGLRLLTAILADEGRSSLTKLAGEIGIPLPTAHRLALTLECEGFLKRGRKGYYHCGKVLEDLRNAGNAAVIAAARLRRPLARLAAHYSAHVHFGVFDGGMVTYLIKENGTDSPLFTAENMQLEAYCSGIGKVLLSALDDHELEQYLSNGPFIPLTANTITDPARLRLEIELVRKQGLALDRFEIRDDLFCIAVPVRGGSGEIVGAASISLLCTTPDAVKLGHLQKALTKIVKRAVD
jgi:IclR family transcriptional regulator, acetate operon repressor